jgi:tetratricopeptide (TPR) repeat protein
MNKPNVFISYSHKDEEWKDRLVSHLGALRHQGLINLWEDRLISAGEEWYKNIQDGIDASSVAILLVSPNSLTSEFILRDDVSSLLQRRKEEGAYIIPVIVEPCAWQSVGWLRRMQTRPKDGQPLSAEANNHIEADLAAIANEISFILKRTTSSPNQQQLDTSLPTRVSIERLPVVSQNLFGREQELKRLDDAWSEPGANVLSLVAWGGVGKTALVNYWMRQMAQDNYRGAFRVYAWSFYNQGDSNRTASADQFIEMALTWFGDADPRKGSPWDKGERLARLVQAHRTLLILDGLERLQYPPGIQEGRLKDQAVLSLLCELASHNPGLCIITTRLPITDLQNFQEISFQSINLENLSPKAGSQLLRAQGVTGDESELEQATMEFGGHSLALTLLGSYLDVAHEGDISSRSKISSLQEDINYGRHARRIMESYEKWLGEGPELSVLRLLGLFDRPVDSQSLAALCAPPPISGLTDHLQKLSKRKWQQVLGRLRRAKLLAESDSDQPNDLDTHPLVREYFGEQLKKEQPLAWREGNERLYEHLKRTTKEFPDTIEEMQPLIAAVIHGCRTERYKETLYDLYWRRISRGSENYITKKLGAIDADLAALSGFFEQPWRQTIAGLSEEDRGFVLSKAGFCLRAIGRFDEAVQPIQAGLDLAITQSDFANAARSALNLYEVFSIVGDLTQATSYAQQSVSLADLTGDAFLLLSSKAGLADVLHQRGLMSESEAAFREAENIQKRMQPQFPLLYSVSGFQFCTLLLDQNKYKEVQNRAALASELVGKSMPSLLAVALDHLSLGRAYLLQAQAEEAGDFAKAASHLERATDGLRQAGASEFIVLALLARVDLRRVTGSYDRARSDLEEAFSISNRGSMRLRQADCHLAYAHLYLAIGEMEKARNNLTIAKELIEQTGYHRRDRDIAELEKML